MATDPTQALTEQAASNNLVDPIGNGIVIQPANLTYNKEESGKETVNFQLSGRDRLLYELFIIQQNKALNEENVKQIQDAIYDLSNFLKSIVFKPGADKLNPAFSYELFDPATIRFYPPCDDPSQPNYNPDYAQYLQRFAELNQLRQQGEVVTDELQAYCDQAEVRFFAGTENERLRLDYMKRVVESHLKMPFVHFAVLQIIYSQLELGQIKAKAKKVAKSKPNNSPFKKSGHLVNQQLRHVIQDSMSLFESLQADTRKAISESGVELEAIVEGIRLTPSEHKIIDCLCKFLNTKSQTTDPNAKDYFAGNVDIQTIDYDGDRMPLPKIAITFHELAREYIGDEAPSGKDVINAGNILFSLAKKNYLIKYVKKSVLSDGIRTQTIERFRPLIEIVNYTELKTSLSGENESQFQQVVVELNPIFIDQIKSSYIEYPADIIQRTATAYGNKKVHDSALRLRDYLMREKSHKRSKSEYGLDNLYKFLCEDELKAGRKGRVMEQTKKAIEMVLALGLITKHELVEGKQGQKMVFHINKDWH